MANASADKVTQMQKSLKAYLTRALTSAEGLCNTIVQYQERASELIFQTTFDNIKHTQGLLEQLYDIYPGDSYLAGFDHTITRGDEAIDKLVEAKDIAIAQAYMQQQPQQVSQQLQLVPTHVSQSTACANDAVKPFLLTTHWWNYGTGENNLTHITQSVTWTHCNM